LMSPLGGGTLRNIGQQEEACGCCATGKPGPRGDAGARGRRLYDAFVNSRASRVEPAFCCRRRQDARAYCATVREQGARQSGHADR